MSDTTNSLHSKPNWRQAASTTIIILACMVGAAIISWTMLIRQSIRLDEAQSLWQTAHSIGGTLRVVAQDVHVPLYHVILHFWQVYLGNDIVMARLLSLGLFLITIPLVYLLAKTILTRGWALFATAVFSFLPFMDWYASEARMYTLLVLFATLSQYFFIKIIKGEKAWRGYGITAVIGAYSHYFFMFNLASQGLFYLFNRTKFAAGTFKRFVVVAGLVILGLMPWIIYFVALGAAKNTAPLLTNPSTVDFFNAYSNFMFGFQDDKINTILVSLWPLTVLIAFFAIKRGQRVTPEVSYIATAAFLPIILAYVLSFVVDPFFLSRYMISCVAPLVILGVWFISNYGPKLSRVAASVIVVGIVLTTAQQNFSTTTPIKEDYRAVARQLESEARPQDLIVLSAPFTIYPFEYYYDGSSQIATLPIWDRQAEGTIPAFERSKLKSEVDQLNKDHRYIYLLLSQDQGYEETIRQHYLGRFKEVSRREFNPGLNLYVFQVGYNDVPDLGSPTTQIKPRANGVAQ